MCSTPTPPPNTQWVDTYNLCVHVCVNIRVITSLVKLIYTIYSYSSYKYCIIYICVYINCATQKCGRFELRVRNKRIETPTNSTRHKRNGKFCNKKKSTWAIIYHINQLDMFFFIEVFLFFKITCDLVGSDRKEDNVVWKIATNTPPPITPTHMKLTQAQCVCACMC